MLRGVDEEYSRRDEGIVALNRFVLVRRDASQILLLLGEHGWTLPAVQTPCLHKWWRESSAVNEAVRSQYGLDVVVLRCVRILQPEERSGCEAVFLVDSQNPAQEPVQGSWIPEQELVHLAFADPAHRAVLLETLGALRDANTTWLMPWERTGWFERASAWIAEEAGGAGYVLTGPIVQVRNHGYLSCVLKAPTARGALYLKSCPPMWAQEPALTAELAARQGSLVPSVIGVRPEDCWLLTVEVPGQKLNTLRDRELYLSLWEDLLTRYGRAQIDYAHDPDRLLCLGGPDWRVDRLSAFIRHFLLELVPAVGEEHRDFPVWQRTDLERAATYLEELSSRLATYEIPDTLHHGDFHSVNILTDGRSCRVVDWAFQAGMSHPFFFMSVVFEEHDDLGSRERLRAHYLRLWMDFEPMDRLVDAFELAQPVARLHAAIGHYVQLGNARMPWESRQEKEALAYYLTCVVTSVPHPA